MTKEQNAGTVRLSDFATANVTEKGYILLKHSSRINQHIIYNILPNSIKDILAHSMPLLDNAA